jgi:hypothetical protein
MNLHFSSAPALVLAAAISALPSVSEAASWPQATGPSIFDADFSNCNWTADAINETSCGFKAGWPVGTYNIVNGALHIRTTKEQDATRAHHHTDIEPIIPGFTNDRSAHIGEAYWYQVRMYLENWTSEDSWEILTQWQSMYDSSAEASRNPPVSLLARNGRFSLVIRAGSEEITPPPGTPGRYDRDESINLGPIISDAWIDWVFRIKWDPFGVDGSIAVWQNGKLLYEEYGQPNTFNDTRGPIWSMGIYKYFDDSQVSERRMRVDDVHAAEAASGDID